MTEEDGCQDDADDAEHVRSQVDAKLQFHEIKIEVNILDIQEVDILVIQEVITLIQEVIIKVIKTMTVVVLI